MKVIETLESVVGSPQKVIYTNECVENPFSIIAITKVTGQEYIVRGPVYYNPRSRDNEFQMGVPYEFFGRKENTPGYGEQLHFRFHAMSLGSDTDAGAAVYLQRFEGLGAKTASRLVSHYGGREAIELLKNDPEKVIRDGQATRKVAEATSKQLRLNEEYTDSMLDLTGMLDGHGFRKDTARLCHEAWGSAAAARVRENPFVLMIEAIQGAGYKTCDSLHKSLKLNRKDKTRLALAGWYHLRSKSHGSVWLPAGQVTKAFKEAGLYQTTDSVPAKDLYQYGMKHNIFATIMHNDQPLVAEYSAAKYESLIAEKINTMLSCQEDTYWPNPADIGGLSKHQEVTLEEAMSGRVGILTGTPGTGKTFCTARLIQTAVHQGMEVMVCSPTGRAAQRLNEALKEIGCSPIAKTIHSSMRYMYERVGLNPAIRFAHDNENPLSAELIIVDETSMVESQLMAHLLNAVRPSAHLLFVGDDQQLPPVGNGHPFRDMIRSERIPLGQLTEVRRNSGAIVESCRLISETKPLSPVSVNELHEEANYAHIEIQRQNQIPEAINQVLYWCESAGFDPVEDMQFITSQNKNGEFPREALNNLLQERLNGNNPHLAKTVGYKVDDKAICLRNGDYTVCAYRDGEVTDPDNYVEYKDKSRLANGQIGYVRAVNDKHTIFEFDGTLYKVSNYGEKGADSLFSLGWAVTVHKFQGSESPVVVLFLDPKARFTLDKKALYTGFSRGKKALITIGPLSEAHAAMIRTSNDNRKTLLVEKLKGEVGYEL